jgi:protease I
VNFGIKEEVAVAKKAVLVIAERMFRDEEYLEPKAILEQGGVEVVTASTTTQEVIGKLGHKVRPDLLVSQIKPSDYQVFALVGGGGATQYFDDETVHKIAREFVQAGKVVAAICIAPVILARAGLLQGKKATVFPDGVADLTNDGAIYTAKSVERDGKLITANGPDAAEAFGHEILRQLQKD